MWSNKNYNSNQNVYTSLKTSVNDTTLTNANILSHKSKYPGIYSTTIQYNKDNLVSNLTVLSINEGSITIEFSLKPNIFKYIIRAIPSTSSLLETFTYEYNLQVNSFAQNIIYTIPSLIFGIIYTIQVEATDYFKVSTMIQLDVKTIQPPSYPRNININNITNNSAVISFTKPPQEIDSYIINIYLDFQKTSLFSSYDFSANSLLSLNITGFQYNTNYFVSIISINVDGISKPSNIVSFLTKQIPDPPTQLITTGQTINSITINFQPPIQYVEKYILYRNLHPFVSWYSIEFSYSVNGQNNNIFQGFFSINNSSVMQSFYINNDLNTNILLPVDSQDGEYIADNLFIYDNSINQFAFTQNGVSISNIPTLNNTATKWVIRKQDLLNNNSMYVPIYYLYYKNELGQWNEFLDNQQNRLNMNMVIQNCQDPFINVDIINIPGNSLLPYSIPNLLSNTKYNFNIHSYNSDGTSSQVQLNNVYTLPEIVNITFGNISSTSIQLNVLNASFYYLIVERTDSYGTINKYRINTLNDENTILNSSLIPNTLYTYKITPYNFIDLSGQYYNVGSIYTYSIGRIFPLLNNANFYQLQVNWTGYYNTVSVERNNGMAFLIDPSDNYPVSNNPGRNVTGFVTDDKLLLNEIYSYKVTFYNGNNVPYVLSYDVSSVTLSTVTNASYGIITPYSINIINIMGYYSNLQYVRTLDDINTIFNILNITDTSLNDTGLLPNTKYSYRFIPYNQKNIIGIQYSLGDIITRPIFNFASIGTVTQSTIELREFTGNYSKLEIQRLNNNIITYDVSNITADSWIDTGLSLNTLYTYKIIPYNPNDLSGVFYNELSQYTNANGQIAPITYVNTEYNKLQINWTGTYSSALITKNNGDALNPLISNNYSSSNSPQISVVGNIIDTGLLPNTVYSYTVTLLSGNGIATVISSDISMITIPEVTGGSFGTITTTSIELLDISGAYNNVKIDRTSDGTTFTNDVLTMNPGTIVTDSSLTPNTSYSYRITPYNSLNVNGNSIIIGPVYTLPIINTAEINTITNIKTTLLVSYSAQTIKINRIVNEITYENVLNITTPTTTTMDINLNPNTLYGYSLIPYNITGNAGPTFTVAPKYTHANCSFTNFTNITSSQIQINWSGIYNFITVTRNPNIIPIVILNRETSPTPQIAYNRSIIDTGLSPNTSYEYRIKVYNDKNINNNSSNDTIEKLKQTTLSIVNVANYRNITYNKIGILVSSASYKKIEVFRVGVTNSVGNIIYPDTSFNDINLNSNTPYSYNLVSYNSSDVSSIPYTGLGSVTTDPSGSISPCTNITTGQIQINWSGYYNSVKIMRNIDSRQILSRNNSTDSIYTNKTDFFIDTNLNANTNYTYTVTLYNNYNLVGTAIVITSTINAVTLPIFTGTPSFGTITTNSIYILSILGDFSNCTIRQYPSGSLVKNMQKPDTSYNDTGLIADTSYNYSLTPFNSVGLSGEFITIGPKYTRPNITNANYGTLTSNSILITGITGRYYGIDVYRNTTENKVGTITSYGTSFTDISLLPNNLYNYILVPFNEDGLSGTAFNMNSIYTLTYGIINPCTNITDSQIQINWSAIDSSSQVIRNIGSLTITNNMVSPTPQSTYNHSITDTGLIPNTTYSYTVKVFNGNNISNTLSTDISAVTLSKITEVTYSNITKNSLSINIKGIYQRIQIDRINNSTTETTYNALSINTPSTNINDPKIITDSGPLIPNTQYSYILTHYNSVEVPGVLPFQSAGVYTLPFIDSNSINFGTITTQSIAFSVLNSYYNRIDISYNNTKIGDITFPSNSFNHIGLNADTVYSYSLTPYNVTNNAGSSVNFGPKYTLPIIRTASGAITDSLIYNPYYDTNISSLSSMNIYFYLVNMNISYVSIQAYNGITKTPYGTANVYSEIFTQPKLFQGLQPGASYSFILTPYNNLGVAGLPVVNTTAVYTLSSVSNILLNATETTVDISFTRSDLSYVQIFAYNGATNVSNAIYSRPTASVTYTNLTPYLSYSFSVVPYNNVNAPGLIVTSSIITLTNFNMIVPNFSNSKILATGGSKAYYSTNNGSIWNPYSVSFTNKGNICIASDSIQANLAISSYNDSIYTSTDSGSSWVTSSSGIKNWTSLTSDSTGSKLTALAYNDNIYFSSTSGSSWSSPTTSNPTANWRSVASSDDGSKLVACVNGGKIFTSTDSGINWIERESTRNWSSVASSADGSKLVACVNFNGSIYGKIYTSTDSGSTWFARESARNWRSVASSDDGSKLVACVVSGQIYTSTDSGVSWTAKLSNLGWQSIASSSDGSKLVACVVSGKIYTSTDSGINWIARESSRLWYSVASSDDGSKLVACVYNGQIYISTDSGVSWTARESARRWLAVASSSDGSKLVACVNPGQIYTSTNSGSTWIARESSRTWQSIASSADGSNLVACVNNGQIYTSSDSGLTWSTNGLSKPWKSIASSSDGTKSIACATNDYIYTSNDSSVTWTTNNLSSGIKNWTSVAISSDGTTSIACVYGEYIYTSINSGVTWTTNNYSSGIKNWVSVAISTNGRKMAGCTADEKVYSSIDSGLTWTAISNNDTWKSVSISSDSTKICAVSNSGNTIFI